MAAAGVLPTAETGGSIVRTLALTKGPQAAMGERLIEVDPAKRGEKGLAQGLMSSVLRKNFVDCMKVRYGCLNGRFARLEIRTENKAHKRGEKTRRKLESNVFFGNGLDSWQAKRTYKTRGPAMVASNVTEKAVSS